MMTEAFLTGKKVLVTGGAGFIGSHLVDELLQKGAEVRVVDDLSRGSLRNIEHCRERIEFVKGDLTYRKTAIEVTEDCDVCFHLAAVVGGVEYMTTHPAEIYKSMLINYNVIDACRKKDVDRFLYTSSACTYPVNLQVDETQPPLREDDVLKCGAMPDSDYGWVKLLGEIQCQAYHEAYGLKTIIVRPFNPYGPRECFDPEHSHVIPALIRKAVLRENPFYVWGDGGQTRAFTYITDLVEGMILAIENAPYADPINLSESNYVSVRDLAELILKLTGYDALIIWDKTKPQGVRTRKSDMTKAYRILGWRPKVCLEEGLKKTIDWFVKNEAANS
jgi:nucleoside-diphosphate-sugar epimerase